VWDGRSLADQRVLIRCYHGLGDTIQFARFIPLVQRVAREVTVWAQPSLIPLLRTMPGAPALLPLHDGTPEVEYDVDVEIMELAYVFRVAPDTIPRDVPYFHVEPMFEPASEPRRPAVGIVWRSGDWDSARDVPLRAFAELLALRGVTFYSLQRDARETHENLVVVNGVDDPLSTARLMRSMDLVISVDTMTAHLAGALGVPVWTILPRACDWRWMDGREDSPWYPTMRLFRLK
jgi:hypothetical protein